MRTTVDIDAVLLKRLRDAAHERNVPLKDFLNGVLRRGLEKDLPSTADEFRGKAFSMGIPSDPHVFDKALSLAASIEDEGSVAKLLMRK